MTPSIAANGILSSSSFRSEFSPWVKEVTEKFLDSQRRGFLARTLSGYRIEKEEGMIFK